jgi:fido (protein-threonine AMPylation protein)
MDSVRAAKDGTISTPRRLLSRTDVYINHFGVTNQDLLDNVKTEIVSVRMAEILAGVQEWEFDFWAPEDFARTTFR